MDGNENDRLQELSEDELSEVSGGLVLNKNATLLCNACNNYFDVNQSKQIPETCPKCGGELSIFIVG